MPDTPLGALKNLSPRSKSALAEKGILTLEAAAALTDEALLAIEGCGPSSVKRIRDWAAGLPEADSRPVIREPAPQADRRALREFELYKVRIASGHDPDEALRLAKLDADVFEEGASDG